MSYQTTYYTADLGLLGERELEVEYYPTGNQAEVACVWLKLDEKLIEVFNELSQSAQDDIFELCAQDIQDRRADAAELNRDLDSGL